MNIDGTNNLACLAKVDRDPSTPSKIAPLPHMFVVKVRPPVGRTRVRPLVRLSPCGPTDALPGPARPHATFPRWTRVEARPSAGAACAAAERPPEP
jgi:hypothetical protein